jgi:hypothetical protein
MESKYKYFQIALALLGLPVFIFVWFYILADGGFSFIQNDIENPSFGTLVLIIVIISFVTNMINMMVQIRKLKLSSNKIESKYPFPVFDSSIRLSDVDYFTVVVANNKKGYENIWLVKEKKVVMIISSQFYKNFDEMKRYLSNHLESKNTIKTDFIDHFLAKFNYTINKLP